MAAAQLPELSPENSEKLAKLNERFEDLYLRIRAYQGKQRTTSARLTMHSFHYDEYRELTLELADLGEEYLDCRRKVCPDKFKAIKRFNIPRHINGDVPDEYREEHQARIRENKGFLAECSSYSASGELWPIIRQMRNRDNPDHYLRDFDSVTKVARMLALPDMVTRMYAFVYEQVTNDEHLVKSIARHLGITTRPQDSQIGRQAFGSFYGFVAWVIPEIGRRLFTMPPSLLLMINRVIDGWKTGESRLCSAIDGAGAEGELIREINRVNTEIASGMTAQQIMEVLIDKPDDTISEVAAIRKETVTEKPFFVSKKKPRGFSRQDLGVKPQRRCEETLREAGLLAG